MRSRQEGAVSAKGYGTDKRNRAVSPFVNTLTCTRIQWLVYFAHFQISAEHRDVLLHIDQPQGQTRCLSGADCNVNTTLYCGSPKDLAACGLRFTTPTRHDYP